MTTLPEPEVWSDETKAEFLLNNSLSEEEYRLAVEDVCRLGVDPTRLEYLLRDEPWQNPALYLPQIAIRALRKLG
jgi:hypothetical protein